MFLSFVIKYLVKLAYTNHWLNCMAENTNILFMKILSVIYKTAPKFIQNYQISTKIHAVKSDNFSKRENIF